MNPNSKRISLLAILLCMMLNCVASSPYPANEGERVRYEFMIEMPKAYVSGILIMAKTDPDKVDASLVNEFGFSLMDFSYDEKKDKVKLVNVTKKLDKWYIKRTLRADLRHVMRTMREGDDRYVDKKHKITYSFTLLNDPAQ